MEEGFQCDATLSWWMDSFTKPRFKGSGMTQFSPDPRENGNICALTWRGRCQYVTLRMVSWARLTKHCSMDLCGSGSTYLHKRAHKCAKSQQLKMSIKHENTLEILRVFRDEAKPLFLSGGRRAETRHMWNNSAVSPFSQLMRQKPSLGGTSQTHGHQ